VLGASGLAVLEADTAEAERELLELLGGSAPETPAARTGRGLPHVYFTAPPGLRRRARGALELRAGACLCLVPPSRHHDTGRQYAWLPNRAPWQGEAAPLPAAGYGDGDGDADGDGEGMIRQGRRHDTLTSLSGAMRRRGMRAAEIAAALHAVNQSRCDPPLPEGEVGDIAASMANYTPGRPAGRGQRRPAAADELVELARRRFEM